MSDKINNKILQDFYKSHGYDENGKRPEKSISKSDIEVFETLKKYKHDWLVATDETGGAWMCAKIKHYMELADRLNEVEEFLTNIKNDLVCARIYQDSDDHSLSREKIVSALKRVRKMREEKK